MQLQVPRRPRKRHSRETREELAAALGKPATNGGGTSCSLVPFAGEVASPHCVCLPALRESWGRQLLGSYGKHLRLGTKCFASIGIMIIVLQAFRNLTC